MPMELLTLLQRDHHDLERGLDELSKPWATAVQLRTALDGLRLGMTSHAEAEDIVLYHVFLACKDCEVVGCDVVEGLVAEVRDAHDEQEGVLAALCSASPSTATWSNCTMLLRKLVRLHARYEQKHVLPAIRERAPAEIYQSLAGAFATERMRQLGLLEPSAPFVVPELALGRVA